MTVATKAKKNTIKENREAFEKKYFKPFTGTLEKPYDIESAGGKETARPTAKSLVENMPTFEEYAKSGKSKVTCGKYDLVAMNIEFCESSSGFPGAGEIVGSIFFIDRKSGLGFLDDHSSIKYHSLCEDFYTSNVDDDSMEDGQKAYDIFDQYDEDLTNIPQIMFKNGSFFINADEDAQTNNGTTLAGDNDYENFPTVSFQCLANLIEDKLVESQTARLKILGSADIFLVDFTPETKKTMSASLKEAYAKIHSTKKIEWIRNQKPIEAGFTLINNGNGPFWHKSATVVLRSDKTFLMGQDEGTYFGCILKDHPKSVQGAYESLIPEEAQGARGVIRQGEWFAIPVAEKDVPKKTDPNCLVWGDSEGDNGFLFPVEDEDSNLHTLTGEWVVSKNGNLFARNFTVQHDDHGDLCGDNGRWYTFARNTALASYSAEKVD